MFKGANNRFVFFACVGLAAITASGCSRANAPPVAATIATTADPLKAAVDRIEQDRGELMGRKATVEVPAELKHYADRRRFLAMQEADSEGNAGKVPHDFVDLVLSIKNRELMELKPLGDDYVLYGVGLTAGGEPFSHYDSGSGQNIPLLPNAEQLREESLRAINAVAEFKTRVAYLAGESKSTRNRVRRVALVREVSRARAELRFATTRARVIAAFVGDPKRRNDLLNEYRLLAEAAQDFEGEGYDLGDGDARRRFRVRLLSFLRPDATDVLTEIAHAYKETFDRRLPVSSLIRPEQYQRELMVVNANAARGPATPHSTGRAFDIYYGYMSAAEQEYVMSEIARLKQAGRVEALRESRDNIHVYVFAKGQRPNEKLVTRAIARKKPGSRPKRAGAGSQH